MTYLEWLAVVLAAMIVGALATWMVVRRHRSERLTARFGPEYERALVQEENRAAAERLLEAREKRVDLLEIVPLERPEIVRFTQEWKAVQARFVDNPAGAVHEADDLIAEVMLRRGYPMGDFERRAADLSVDHAQVLQNFRAGHELAERSRAGKTSTEDLRRAMIHYRALFEELLEPGPAPHPADVPPRREDIPARRGWSRRPEEMRIERKK